jgi:predicted Zn-dependent protease
LSLSAFTIDTNLTAWQVTKVPSENQLDSLGAKAVLHVGKGTFYYTNDISADFNRFEQLIKNSVATAAAAIEASKESEKRAKAAEEASKESEKRAKATEEASKESKKLAKAAETAAKSSQAAFDQLVKSMEKNATNIRADLDKSNKRKRSATGR